MPANYTPLLNSDGIADLGDMIRASSYESWVEHETGHAPGEPFDPAKTTVLEKHVLNLLKLGIPVTVIAQTIGEDTQQLTEKLKGWKLVSF